MSKEMSKEKIKEKIEAFREKCKNLGISCSSHDHEVAFEMLCPRWQEIISKIYDIYIEEEIENKENFLGYLEQMIARWKNNIWQEK